MPPPVVDKTDDGQQESQGGNSPERWEGGSSAGVMEPIQAASVSSAGSRSEPAPAPVLRSWLEGNQESGIGWQNIIFAGHGIPLNRH